MADLATISANLAHILAAIEVVGPQLAAVVTQLAADGVGGPGGLGDSDCRGTGNQRDQHDEAASHSHFLLGSADQTKTGCRR